MRPRGYIETISRFFIVVPPADIDQAIKQVGKGARMAKYQLWQNQNGEWRWHLKSRNGEIVCWAEGYSSERSALDSINWTKANAKGAPIEWE